MASRWASIPRPLFDLLACRYADLADYCLVTRFPALLRLFLMPMPIPSEARWATCRFSFSQISRYNRPWESSKAGRESL
jgi:hypothetical protein